MTVVVAIVLLIGGLMLANYEEGRKSRDLQIDRDTLVSALREMQNNVLSGVPFSSTEGARSFALSLSATSTAYETFVEAIGTGTVRQIEPLQLSPKVIFSNIEVIPAGEPTQSVTAVEIRFISPFGEIRITARNGTTVVFTEQRNVLVNLQLQYQGSTRAKTVTIDGISGRIN